MRYNTQTHTRDALKEEPAGQHFKRPFASVITRARALNGLANTCIYSNTAYAITSAGPGRRVDVYVAFTPMRRRILVAACCTQPSDFGSIYAVRNEITDCDQPLEFKEKYAHKP